MIIKKITFISLLCVSINGSTLSFLRNCFNPLKNHIIFHKKKYMAISLISSCFLIKKIILGRKKNQEYQPHDTELQSKINKNYKELEEDIRSKRFINNGEKPSGFRGDNFEGIPNSNNLAGNKKKRKAIGF